MKGEHMIKIEVRTIALYPTWFRWKLSWEMPDTSNILLYIPHGSDERCPLLSILAYPTTFISHMVQMKAPIRKFFMIFFVNFISHMVQMKEILSML